MVATTGDGTKSVTSNSTGVCTASGLASPTSASAPAAHRPRRGGTDYAAADGTAQTFSVGQRHAEHAVDQQFPAERHLRRRGFTATVSTTGDGHHLGDLELDELCTVSGLAVSYVGVGTCSLTAHVAAGTDYSGDGLPRPSPSAKPHRPRRRSATSREVAPTAAASPRRSPPRGTGRSR